MIDFTCTYLYAWTNHSVYSTLTCQSGTNPRKAQSSRMVWQLWAAHWKTVLAKCYTSLTCQERPKKITQPIFLFAEKSWLGKKELLLSPWTFRLAFKGERSSFKDEWRPGTTGKHKELISTAKIFLSAPLTKECWVQSGGHHCSLRQRSDAAHNLEGHYSTLSPGHASSSFLKSPRDFFSLPLFPP